jgi:hypothetical protein
VPPRPGHHLDLSLVLPAPIADPAALDAALRAAGLAADPAPGRAVPGGYRAVRLDRPAAPTLYANRQGGFRVACPACGANLVPAFSAAMARWREGGPFAVGCAACGQAGPLDAVVFRPPAAFGAAAVVLVDAGAPALTGWGEHAFRELLGPFTVVGSRR